MTTAESITELCRFMGSRRMPRDPWATYRKSVEWAKEQGLIRHFHPAPTKSVWGRQTPTPNVVAKYEAIKALVDTGLNVEEAARQLGYGPNPYYRVKRWRKENGLD